eukprot:750537-Hanusia_phi.AAC.1
MRPRRMLPSMASGGGEGGDRSGGGGEEERKEQQRSEEQIVLTTLSAFRYGYTPEGFNLADGRVHQGQRCFLHFVRTRVDDNALPLPLPLPSSSSYRSYPLRPELIESTMYLYQATRDPHYVQVGRDILFSLERTRVPCGHAAIDDRLSSTN